MRTRLLLTHVGLVALGVAAAARLQWLGVVLAVILAIVVGAFVGSWLRRRIRDQLAAATQIADGDFLARAPALERDEIGALGRTLNQISERQASQIETLKTNRDELETVLDSVADGLIAIDADDRITHLNPESIRMFDAQRDSVGRPFWEVIRDASLADLVARVKEDLQPAESSLVITHPAPRRELEVRVAPKRRLEDQWRGAVLAFRDVTLLHRLEAVRRDFVANVSHEMKTPLTSIQGYVETLQEGAIEDGQVAREFLEKIDRNARNLGHLVTDLLVLSRVEAGGIQVDPEPFGAFTVVSEATAACADKAREKTLDLHVMPGPRDVLIRGDRDLLVRALVNLLDNAIQYTRPGGRIDITMAKADAHVEVTVADTGIGIPSNELLRIFERFYRVDKARSRALGGTGLGLAIVKHVAERHGGSIRVVSEEGRGSAFTLSLPVAA